MKKQILTLLYFILIAAMITFPLYANDIELISSLEECITWHFRFYKENGKVVGWRADWNSSWTVQIVQMNRLFLLSC